MLCNKCKFNQNNIEFLVISFKLLLQLFFDYILVGEEVIKFSKQVRNLEVGLNKCLDFKEYVKIICKSVFFCILQYS